MANPLYVPTVGQNDRELAILKELMAMRDLGMCTDAEANAAARLACDDVNVFGNLNTSDSADLALELVAGCLT